ncbi:hypothetical protein V6N11_004138 [Hibiscus sabdariffa]|uniref:Glucosamine-phosphate N-acetyltransferase n=1 Tax=Hibiscus sabdariffa TaxID=183260 RepID=A0ABR2SFA2_9ROSI
MEAIKKQATKLREQVAKQQQAVLRHLGHFSNEDITVDEAELQCHQKLQDLYISTKAAKHLQRNIVRGIEGFIATSTKLIEIARKLADDCCKYGAENQDTGTPLARAALYFGKSHKSMEDEREVLLGILGEKVSEPLRELITGAPLEDARHLTHRYDRFRQEVEAQAADVLRRKSKTRESDISAETYMKLKHAEERSNELKSSMMILGTEATAAMLSAEDQQQKITFQALRAMVDAEKSYHQHMLAILEKLYAEMTLEEQQNESLNSVTSEREVNVSIAHDNFSSNGSEAQGNKQSNVYFIAKVVHPFDAEADGELSLAVGDYVVVRQVGPSGWSEGECKGKAGWFPAAYVERQEKAPKGCDLVAAVAFGTSHEALAHRANFTTSQVLLVIAAAGGVGISAVQIGGALVIAVVARRRVRSSNTTQEMVSPAVPSTTSTQIMMIRAAAAAFPSKFMELRWIRSNSRRKIPNPKPGSKEFGSLKSVPPPLTMPIYISTDPSHINLQELSELYTSCNHSCHRFPKVDPNTGIVEEALDLDKLRVALSHSCVIVSVFCKPQHVKVSNTTKQIQNQEQQKQMEKGFVGELMESMLPLNPSNGQLVGFGRAFSDLGLTASIFDVMVAPSLQGFGIGTIIVKKIVRMLTSRDIYDIAALCSTKERFFFKACGFRDDILGSTTMMYSRTVSSTCSEGDQMVTQAGRKLLLAPPLRVPPASSKTTKPQS